MTTITGGPNGTLVQYKLAGKLYNTQSQEANASADPFDEIRLGAGETFEVPADATLIAQRELGGAPAQGGTPEDIREQGNEPTPTPTGTAVPGGQGGTPD